MIEAIIPKKKAKIKPINEIDDARFKVLINEVYDLMTEYTRIRKIYLTKKNPIQIGNVRFWFEDNELKFSHNVKKWDEAAIVHGLNFHFHELHFNALRR